MTDAQAAAVREIIQRSKRGESLLDDQIIDIAMDQFIEIGKLSQQIMDEEGIE